MTKLQDEFYTKHPYLVGEKIFANLSDDIIQKINTKELDLDKWIEDYEANNAGKPGYKTITNKDRYLLFMRIVMKGVEYDVGGNPDVRSLDFTKKEHLKGSFQQSSTDLYNLKRMSINSFPYVEGYSDSLVISAHNKGLNPNIGNLSEEEREAHSAYTKKVASFRNYLEKNFEDKGYWMFQFAPGWHNPEKFHRFQLAVKPSIELLEDLTKFANKYDCEWKCRSVYHGWRRIDPVDIYTANTDIEGQKKDLAAIVAKYGYDKAHCDKIDRFFDSERIANGAYYVAREYTRKEDEDLIARAEKLDKDLAKYGVMKLEQNPGHSHPMSAGEVEVFKTSINTYDKFVNFIGGLEKANDSVIPTRIVSQNKIQSVSIKNADECYIFGSKTVTNDIVSAIQNPFAKMSDAELAAALKTAKDHTYWKFGLGVEQRNRQAKKQGKEVQYFVYADGGEHHEVVPTFTKDLDKEVCGQAVNVLFSDLPQDANVSEGNPYAKIPLSNHLLIHIDITAGTGTVDGDKAAYQKAQSLLLAAYDDGIRKFNLKQMTAEEIKVWGDVRSALAGQGKNIKFVFDDANERKIFDSHKDEFDKIETLNKQIVSGKTVQKAVTNNPIPLAKIARMKNVR